MLAYLACQPEMRAERGALADMLWSDRGEDQARASLRRELSVVNKALGDSVQADQQVAWLMDGTVTMRRESGDFLQGFVLGSEGFEDWLRQERMQVQTNTAVGPHPKATDRATLVVQPFEELGAADTDMFAEGVVEEITGALRRSRDFDVIARQSAYALRGRAISVPEVSRLR